MKARLTMILLLCAFAVQASADNLGFTEEKPLLFSLDKDYPPLEYLDSEGQPHGFDVQFTDILMNRLNIPFKYCPNTWEAVADDVMKGQTDLAMMVFSPYRKDQINYSRAVFRLYYQIVYRREDRPISHLGLRSVEGKTIAFMDSRPIRDTLTKAGAKVCIVKDLKKTIKELSAGKYDAVICFRYQSKYIMNQLKADNLMLDDLTLMAREYCYVSKNKALIDAINKELDKMEEEGIIDKVYGDVRTEFGGLKIPTWVWYLVAALVLGSLLTIIVLQRRSRIRLKKEMERAQKSEELKDIFLSNLSHALRTPLNAIIGFSDLLMSSSRDEMPEDEQNHLLTLINSNGLQLLHLINELLSLSDIEGKEKFFNMEVTDIVAEFDKYVGEIRPQLHPGVELIVNEPVEGIRALVDRRFMRMVNMQLLENAMQHTTEGKITLTYYMKQGGIYVEVRDTGTGLPPQLKENIFALLNDKNTYLQDEIPGLGLSICKAICEKIGGQIGARDNDIDGRGTIFWTWAEVQFV
jgi:signal transduction histidine kinase